MNSTMQDKYTQFWLKHRKELSTLIIAFLQNCEEGEKLYSPYIRGAQIDYTNNQSYLEFHRKVNPITRNMDDISLNKSNPVIDFTYLANILRLFYYCDDAEERERWEGIFKYNDKGQLRFALQLIDTVKRDCHGNPIKSHGHLISKPGTHVNDFGVYITSPKGLYTPHNSDNKFAAGTKHGHLWNMFFNPEYSVKNAQGKIIRTDRNQQTGQGQFPVHWFPKYGDNPRLHLSKLSELLTKIVGKMTTRGKALFLAFLKCVDSGQLKGYENFKTGDYGKILNPAEHLIDLENPNKYTYSNNRMDRHNYLLDDDGYYRDEDGNPSENDMNYLSQHLGVESKTYTTMKNTNIIRLTESDLHKIIKESVNTILQENNFKNPNNRIISAINIQGKKDGKTPEEIRQQIKDTLDNMYAQRQAIQDINKDIAKDRETEMLPVIGDDSDKRYAQKYNDSRREFYKPITNKTFDDF